MEISRNREKLSMFFDSGIYRFEDSNSFFIDPVRVLNNSYARLRVCPSKYYSRFFEPVDKEPKEPSSTSKKRKRKEKKKERPYELNEREQSADRRHQEAKPLLLKACESMLGGAYDLLECTRDSRNVSRSSSSPLKSAIQQSFVDLGQVWQAHLYDITLRFHRSGEPVENGGGPTTQSYERVVPLFNNLVVNETGGEVEAEFMDTRYILPRESCFYMSDLKEVHNLIPAENDSGFDLIVIDPPWENGSARQKSRYPTLPNRYFLSLPIKQLGHKDGALIALWVTNREKLRCFVEEELFPSWGVKYMATFYWLKVKADGSPIGDLDLFHHRPYECLLLGQCNTDVLDSNQTSRIKPIPDNQVIISIPGDFSRKPPIGGILREYVAGQSPSRCLELFAREMNPGWVSWGNEPLCYQESSFFLNHEESRNSSVSPSPGAQN